MSTRHLSDQVGRGRFSVMCQMNDALRALVEAHTDYLTSGGDPDRAVYALTDARVYIDKALATLAKLGPS